MVGGAPLVESSSFRRSWPAYLCARSRSWTRRCAPSSGSSFSPSSARARIARVRVGLLPDGWSPYCLILLPLPSQREHQFPRGVVVVLRGAGAGDHDGGAGVLSEPLLRGSDHCLNPGLGRMNSTLCGREIQSVVPYIIVGYGRCSRGAYNEELKWCGNRVRRAALKAPAGWPRIRAQCAP